MAKQGPIKSEGEQLADILDELKRDQTVREIAGWTTGFANLDRALDGFRPGFYLLVGRPSIGKTAFAKQLLDQMVQFNAASGAFFSFSETKKELRIRTLARLSRMDSREIRRGSAFLLHWYGVPRLRGEELEEVSPSWDRVKLAAEQAKSWLDSLYLIECDSATTIESIVAQIESVQGNRGGPPLMVVVDDCQRLGARDTPVDVRLPLLVEQLQSVAVRLQIPLLTVWPDLAGDANSTPQVWAEKVASADVIMVMAMDAPGTTQSAEPTPALTLHIVKNRGNERGKLTFVFDPAFASFKEICPAP